MAISRAIEMERSFDRLTVLADALEDAGCEDTTVLEHCRREGRDWLGCWVTDFAAWGLKPGE